ncbi:MAG TPA: hypothetical protein VNI35_00640, partial [Nitrospira sp.]|nr:hypothetical protein [Nitrospira sp.]
MMTNDELDRILSSNDDDILPSSGLAGSVMEAIRSEATTPPIPFPWERALPGLAAAGVALVGFLVLIMDQFLHGAVTPIFTASIPSWWIPVVQEAGWSIVAVALSLILVKLS